MTSRRSFLKTVLAAAAVGAVGPAVVAGAPPRRIVITPKKDLVWHGRPYSRDSALEYWVYRDLWGANLKPSDVGEGVKVVIDQTEYERMLTFHWSE